MCGLMSDLEFTSFRKSMVIHDTVLRPGVIKQHKPNQY